MARVVVLVGDLLFGSRVQGALVAAGHEVELVAEGEQMRARLPGAAVLVVDLVEDGLDGRRLVEELLEEGQLHETGTLGFYSHVDSEARVQAELGGFDLVVARSRMARDAAALVSRLATSKRPRSGGS